MREYLPDPPRSLGLRDFPLFASAEPAELATLGDQVEPVAVRAGAMLEPHGARPYGVYFVLEGELAHGLDLRRILPREVAGLLEVLSGRPLRSPLIALRDSRVLRIRAANLVDLLEDYPALLTLALGSLAAQLVTRDRGDPATAVRPVRMNLPLAFVDRLVLLRHQQPFQHARLQPLAALARLAREVSWIAGMTPARAHQASLGAYVVVRGNLLALDTGQQLGQGDAFGLLETIAGVPYPATLEARSTVEALHWPSHVVQDVLDEHTDLGLAMLEGFASTLLVDRAR